MRIIVLIKQVPGTANTRMDPETGVMIRDAGETIMNPLDEHAVTEAVSVKKNNPGTEVIALTMGPPSAQKVLREACARGADRGILLSHKAFGGAAMNAKSTGYTVGPSAEDAGPADILISLERMNQIIFDRQTFTITAQPAAEMDKIINAARETGCAFPGTTCRHKKATAGENVAACFNEGEPDFKCAAACLCGLELVLADGSITTLGEKSLKDLDNYQLTYVMGGHREEKAVLSGIYLRLLPGEQDQYWLVATLQDLEHLPGVWRPLIQKHRREIDTAIGIKPDHHPGLAGMLHLDQLPPACSLVSLRCRPVELEPLLELLDGDTYVAGGTHQKQAIAAFCSNLPAELQANPQLTSVDINEQEQDINPAGLYAIYWLKEERKFSLFYVV